MKWAEELKKEYSKIAKENQSLNLPNGKHLPLGETGRVRDKIAKDLDMGSGETYRKAEFIHKNGDEELNTYGNRSSRKR